VTDRIRLGLRFDSAAMRRDLARLAASDWVEHFVTSNYSGTWTVLPLRAPAGATHPIAMIYSDPACDTFVDTPLLARCPAVQRALSAFECPLQAVRVMKLTPGSEIKPHSDFDLDVEHGRARLHIVVATNRDVEFVLNGTRVRLDEGECWYLRLSDPHAVANRGATDRLHLVVDALVNPWLETELARGDHGPAAEPADAGSDLERFRDLVRRDASLQRQLLQHDDAGAFITNVIEAAAAAGLHVTTAEVATAMRDVRRRRWEEPA
jgi:aspartyl/asparaginyl beta-hydroxylase